MEVNMVFYVKVVFYVQEINFNFYIYNYIYEFFLFFNLFVVRFKVVLLFNLYNNVDQ